MERHPSRSRRAGLRRGALLSALVLAVAACADQGASPSWTYGPELSGPPSAEPSAAGSDAPASTPSAPPASPDAGTGPRMTDTTLGVSTVVDGLTEPTALAIIGADDLFVTEKSTGRVYRVQGGEAGEPVLDLAVNFFDERGLLGIATHPNFADNGFVYLYWTSSGQGDGDGGLLGPDTDEPTTLPDMGNRVDRFRWDGSALTFDREILAFRSATLDTDTSGRIRGNHDAGPIVFGTDGMLYAVNGDQNLRGQLQNLPDGPPPDDAHLAGVVARVTDDGSVPDDNPFLAAADAFDGDAAENVRTLWAYGIRNSFGMAVHPDTGELWLTENGDDSWDEVNILPAGANSGWIQTMGPADRVGEFRDLEVASEDGLDNADFPPDQLATSAEAARAASVELEGSRFVDPVLAWKYPVAVTSVALVPGDGLGGSAAGSAWFGTVLTDSLYRYPLAADGRGLDLANDPGLADGVDDNTAKGDVGESAEYVVGSGFGVVTHLVPTADGGSLYVVSLSNGAVYRVAPGAGGDGGASPAPGAPSASPGAGSSGDVTAITIGTDTGSALLFDPTEATVPAGAQVELTFRNLSAVPHNLTMGDGIEAATSTIVAAGAEETISFTAPEPGTYDFVCTLHPGMDGTLTVG